MHPHAVVSLQHWAGGIELTYSKPAMKKFEANVYAPFTVWNGILVLKDLYH